MLAVKLAVHVSRPCQPSMSAVKDVTSNVMDVTADITANITADITAVMLAVNLTRSAPGRVREGDECPPAGLGKGMVRLG